MQTIDLQKTYHIIDSVNVNSDKNEEHKIRAILTDKDLLLKFDGVEGAKAMISMGIAYSLLRMLWSATNNKEYKVFHKKMDKIMKILESIGDFKIQK